jgi:hypothetical protein
MKKILTPLLALLVPAVLCTAQMDRNHKEALSGHEIPPVVLASQKSNFPNAFVTKWHSYSNLPKPGPNDLFYSANYKSQGSNSFKAYFDQQGNVIARMTFLPNYSIPESIRQDVLSANQNSKIKSGDLIELYDRDMVLYRVRVNTDGLLQYLYYDKYAKMLKASRVPMEVLSLN